MKSAKKPSVQDVRILKDYYIMMLDRGLSLKKAQQELASTGFSKTLIDQVGEEFKNYSPKKHGRSKHLPLIIFLVVCLFLALYVLFNYVF